MDKVDMDKVRGAKEDLINAAYRLDSVLSDWGTAPDLGPISSELEDLIARLSRFEEAVKINFAE